MLTLSTGVVDSRLGDVLGERVSTNPRVSSPTALASCPSSRRLARATFALTEEVPREARQGLQVNVQGVAMPDRSSTSTPIASPKDASSAQLVQWTFDRINAQDVDSLRKFWTARSTVHFPTGTCHGSAEIVAYFN